MVKSWGEGINIAQQKVKIRYRHSYKAILLIPELAPLSLPSLSKATKLSKFFFIEGIVLFKDANLEKAIREALGIPTELLRKEDLEQLTEYLGFKWTEELSISDLTGIEYCTNLKELQIIFGAKVKNLDFVGRLGQTRAFKTHSWANR